MGNLIGSSSPHIRRVGNGTAHRRRERAQTMGMYSARSLTLRGCIAISKRPACLFMTLAAQISYMVFRQPRADHLQEISREVQLQSL